MQISQTQQSLANRLFPIFLICIAASLLHQFIIEYSYLGYSGSFPQHMRTPSAFVLVPALVSWILSAILNFKNKQHKSDAYIPSKLMLLLGFLATLSLIAFNKSIFMLEFSFMMLLRSCNLITITIAGYFFSNRKNIKQQKITIALYIVGFLCFLLGRNQEQFKKYLDNIQVTVWMILMFICDALFPYAQIHIKQKYQPSANQMVMVTNKWIVTLTIIYSYANDQLGDMIYFFYSYPLSFVHFLLLGFLAACGQILIMKLIFDSKNVQIAKIVSMRKIVSFILSIVIFSHSNTIIQLIGFAVLAILTVKSVIYDIEHSQLNQYELVSRKDISKVPQSQMIEPGSLQPK